LKAILDRSESTSISRASCSSFAGNSAAKTKVYQSICSLAAWLERNDYCGYDTFDGLDARFLRPLTFNSKFLRTVLQQGVRRFPINLRPILGIAPRRSSKGMGFLARGFVRLHEVTGDTAWWEKAEQALEWLMENKSSGYSGACWGNHFDYQARGDFFLPKGVPTVVWTSLIGHAFLDAHARYPQNGFLGVASSACEHILRDVNTSAEEDTVCIYYTPIHDSEVHNANTLAASLLARTNSYARNESYRALAEKAMRYTARHQRPDGSWYYGEASYRHWIDNFHTAYVLDSFKHYIESTGDERFEQNLTRGYEYWKNTFFLQDGTPKYYDHKVRPIDIQCCSQAIDTLVFFHARDPESLALALNVANWTIDHMQDDSGYFYYRRYSQRLVNKTPTLHWGQATMLCALAGLYKLL
jgi:polysaccharide biosynthesis protein VpsJ